MKREELSERLHRLVGQLMGLEADARGLGEEGVAEHLEVARGFVVTGARLIEPPLEHLKEPGPRTNPIDPLGLAEGIRRDVERIRRILP